MTLELESSTTTIDTAIGVLQANKDRWSILPIARKIEYLIEVRHQTASVAAEWVAAALEAKGITPTSPVAGEEWTSGPWALLYGLNRLIETLQQIEKFGTPRLKSGTIRTRPDEQVIVRVFPGNLYDRLLISGVTAEVWMQPGVTTQNLADTMAVFYKQPALTGQVALVLGAGNIASIAPLDVLYKLTAEGQVCLLKMNPINEYLGKFMERVFAGLIRDGFVQTAYGAASVGAYLCQHPGIDTIHITGSNRTHDAIVWGTGEEGEERRRQRTPLLNKPISSELGNVSPTIVVPGPWTQADLDYQAEHLATQKMHNAGFNCIAAQVMLLPQEWSQTEALLDALRRVFRQTAPRQEYYNGAGQRQRMFAEAHPQAETFEPGSDNIPRTLIADVDSTKLDDVCFTTEAFTDVLAATRLPGATAREFLHNAVAFANDTLWGTLGANILIHPATIKELGSEFEDIIAELRYGCVAINSWTGVGFLLAQSSWGAFPGHTLEDIGSGRGIVHNSLLFDQPQKSVIRQPFYPFPRNLRHGEIHSLPKPPWFITNRTAHKVAPRLVAFEAQPGLQHLAGIFWEALRG